MTATVKTALLFTFNRVLFSAKQDEDKNVPPKNLNHVNPRAV